MKFSASRPRGTERWIASVVNDTGAAEGEKPKFAQGVRDAGAGERYARRAAGFSIAQAALIVVGIVNAETTTPFFNSHRDAARAASVQPAEITQ